MRRLLNYLKNLFLLWPEFWAIPLGLIGLYYSYTIIWWIYPFAVPYPPETLQKFVYAGFVLMFYNGLSWLGIKLNMPGLFTYYKTSFSKSFQRLHSWLKMLVLLSVYFGYLVLLVLIATML